MASNHFDSSASALISQTANHKRTFSPELSSSGSKTSQLEQLSDYSVVCGRGKDSFNHVGNRRFRVLASMFIGRYSDADSKTAKSAIVSEIVGVIRQAGGHFCKYGKGAWFEVGDHHAREKVSALLRDLLHTQYRSSAKAKIARRPRKPIKDEDQQSDQKQVKGTEDSDDTSATSSCWEHSLGFECWLEDSDDLFDINVF
mgnify:CR=1 FL=1